MHQRGFTLIELVVMLIVVGILAICANHIANAEDVDPRTATYTTGVTVGPWTGANSWPYTGTGIAIPLRDRSDDGTVGQFMDWRALQLGRLATGVSQLLENVNFAFDSAEIPEDALPKLDAAAKILSENPEVALELGGHTDLVGSSRYNLDLSTRRAEAIKAALVERGVESERLATVSYGELFPVDATEGPSPDNRRVEVEPRVDLPDLP